ncbi:MAG: formylglycine-generating enzyme family protein [Pseudobdellovibrio sp.]
MINAFWFVLLCTFNFSLANAADLDVLVPAGKFQPFFKELKDQDIDVSVFFMNKYPVTVKEFNDFLIKNPMYQKSKVMALYADQRYLGSWKTDVLSAEELKEKGEQPITNVSWFVARKYCQSKNQRLPTIAEWEYASDSLDPKIIDLLLTWYAKTGDQPLENIGKGKPNKFGLYDMHGLIWELVEDFSSVMISSDSRSKGDRTDGQFCGGGSINAKDSKAYATFMRYAVRSGFRGDYCMKNLGFRCASNK